MKSKVEQLENRGFVAAGIENNHLDTTFEQRVGLLKSKLPIDRTLGARLLANHADLSAINCLINALIIEQKLYSKIEICNSLVSYGKDSVIPLIGILGKIGRNQHTGVPDKDFKKDNYPLPRDIVSRTLIRIGSVVLPDLLALLKTNEIVKLSEVIDAIGFICFYDYQTNVYILLQDCFNKNINNDLIKWKLFRAMSAFPESVSFLEGQLNISEPHLIVEIQRSLTLLKKRGR